jgi:Na+/phosphate symporter
MNSALQVIGGLGLFLLGMSLMTEGLKALAGGTPLGEALAVAAQSQKSSRQRAQIFKWFRTWIAEGLFTSIEV